MKVMKNIVPDYYCNSHYQYFPYIYFNNTQDIIYQLDPSKLFSIVIKSSHS